MGMQEVRFISHPEGQKRVFNYVLSDLEYLKKLIDSDKLEAETHRIGVEQELFLIDNAGRPSPVITEFLKDNDEPLFTTELTRFNLEINLEPIKLENSCFLTLENRLAHLINKAKKRAKNFDNLDLLMIGILPTIRKMDLELNNLTPDDRANAMIDAMKWLKRQDYPLHINGIDELSTTDFSDMAQGCNSSFQIHYQVNPHEFADHFNFAQAIAGPVLAACTNSPILFGKRLWHETRIALFEQAVDTRSSTYHLSDSHLRVAFGKNWVEKSIIELYEDDLSKFKIFLEPNDPDETKRSWDKGEVPKLVNLNVFNGSVFRWTRPCYGLFEGKPHLRIENRLLPSGPTIKDEVANAVFWTGLMRCMSDNYPKVSSRMKFDDAKMNVLKAARYGLGTRFNWIEGKDISAQDLIINELLPASHSGLMSAGVNEIDINSYLKIIEQRVTTGLTGSKWMFEAWPKLECSDDIDTKTMALTKVILQRQNQGKPVHQWEFPEPEKTEPYQNVEDKVSNFMSSALYSVEEDDLIEQVAFRMIKNNYNHAPVADEQGKLKGLITLNRLLEHKMINEKRPDDKDRITVKDIMYQNPYTVNPSTSLIEVIDLMKEHRIKCLPVIHMDKLAGIITEYDILKVTGYLLKRIKKENQNGENHTQNVE